MNHTSRRLLRSGVLMLMLLLPSQVICAAPTQENLINYLHLDGVDVEPSDFYEKTIEHFDKAPNIDVVYLHTNDWCGTSGCMLLIISDEHGRRKEIGGFTTQLPIWLLGRSNSGYPIFRARHYGGGNTNVYCGTLRFNGSKYVEHNPRSRKDGCTGGKPLIGRAEH